MASVDHIKERIAQAAARAGRSADEITLVAVSKTRSVDDIRAVYDQGVRHFGENRTEELAEKRAALADLPDIQWHFIGRLQSRQVGVMAANAHVFHAVDRMKIAQKIGDYRTAAAPLPCFIQLNVSGEASKAGLEASHWEADADQRQALVADIRNICAMGHLSVQGLMTMAPYDAPASKFQQIFQLMSVISNSLRCEEGLEIRPGLSMGMSGDFETAIEYGATYVRIGGALFGS